MAEGFFRRLLGNRKDIEVASAGVHAVCGQPPSMHAAQVCDGLVKGLKHPDWPQDAWEGLKRLVLMTVQCTSVAPSGARGRSVVPRLALGA